MTDPHDAGWCSPPDSEENLRPEIRKIRRLEAELATLKAERDATEAACADEEAAHQDTLRLLAAAQPELATLKAELEKWQKLYGADDPEDGCIDGAQGQVIAARNREVATLRDRNEHLTRESDQRNNCLDAIASALGVDHADVPGTDFAGLVATLRAENERLEFQFSLGDELQSQAITELRGKLAAAEARERELRERFSALAESYAGVPVEPMPVSSMLVAQRIQNILDASALSPEAAKGGATPSTKEPTT